MVHYNVVVGKMAREIFLSNSHVTAEETVLCLTALYLNGTAASMCYVLV